MHRLLRLDLAVAEPRVPEITAEVIAQSGPCCDVLVDFDRLAVARAIESNLLSVNWPPAMSGVQSTISSVLLPPVTRTAWRSR
jgi:hypothetical protein